MTPDYPLLFEPVYVEKPWGGNQLNQLLGKKSPHEKTGESWEISAVKENPTRVTNGKLKGKFLNELCKEHAVALLGEKVVEHSGTDFPLLIKFIDACIPLSVQVHPNDEMAADYDSSGKNEMWVILKAGETSKIYLGFDEKQNADSVRKAIGEERLPNILKQFSPQKSDVFNVPAGTVHAIGENVLLAEVQQTSDLTFRMFDWGRKDENGQSRELHIEESLQAVNFEKSPGLYIPAEKTGGELIRNSYFTVHMKEINGGLKTSTREKGSFIIYMLLEGELSIENPNGKVSPSAGQTVLIPFAADEIILNGTNAHVLEISC